MCFRTWSWLDPANLGSLAIDGVSANGTSSSPGFSVTATEATEGEEVLFTITLDEPQAVSVAYDFRTEAGTAIDGEDYVGIYVGINGRAIFPVSVTERKRRVNILDDGVLG